MFPFFKFLFLLFLVFYFCQKCVFCVLCLTHHAQPTVPSQATRLKLENVKHMNLKKGSALYAQKVNKSVNISLCFVLCPDPKGKKS